MKFYGIKAELEKRLKSTSGGAFQLIAEHFLNNGGVVFGAGFDDDLSVTYKKIVSFSELHSILGSKYVEASYNGTFDSVLLCLSEGKDVLFIGSPCMVAALKSFITSKDKVLLSNLFLIDFICSGVPEKGFWEAYKGYLEKRLKQFHSTDILRLTDFTFRDKAKPDSAHTVSWEYDMQDRANGVTEHKRGECSFFEDRYCRMFAKTISLQERCFRCGWCSLSRPGDLTIGDYWGVEKHHPSFDDGYGVSLCISNNGKGDKLIGTILEHTDHIVLKEDEIMQPRLSEPNKRTILNSLFRKDLMSNGSAGNCDIEMILKKYGM